MSANCARCSSLLNRPKPDTCHEHCNPQVTSHFLMCQPKSAAVLERRADVTVRPSASQCSVAKWPSGPHVHMMSKHTAITGCSVKNSITYFTKFAIKLAFFRKPAKSYINPTAFMFSLIATNVHLLQ